MDSAEDLGLGRNAAGPIRNRASGAFGGVQEAAVLADGKAVGHAGNVVGDGAGSAVGAAVWGCDGLAADSEPIECHNTTSAASTAAHPTITSGTAKRRITRGKVSAK